MTNFTAVVSQTVGSHRRYNNNNSDDVDGSHSIVSTLTLVLPPVHADKTINERPSFFAVIIGVFAALLTCVFSYFCLTEPSLRKSYCIDQNMRFLFSNDLDPFSR